MKLPPHLNALRAFEASARHQSFSAAAAELNVTPAAVGQLVRTLEQWLGTSVFHRNSSGRTRLVATEAAVRALPDIRAGFDRLSLGMERLKEGRSDERRVGKECVSTCRSRWWPYTSKKKKKNK